ncbi:nuclear pore complex protein Nup50-like isoform X2 [Acipenser ruthenus]|uniref:nuclear pore complex protein Nup50-like isoform X2 n=1 Tax=Acipenser ruthenus TaxID=7906 RepID=UPI00145A2005|nr:nuclear pore complex protein Nup50-like isoform X2 [Acipenser ruthenus]
MAKRIADKELTDRNWDQEEESEEAGVFSTASEDVMKSRPIKKAKRRNVGTEADSGGTFKGFKGFSLCGAASGGAGGGAAGFGNGSGFIPLPSLANGSSGLSSTPSFTGFNAASETKTTSGSLTFNGPASIQLQKSDVSTESNGVSQSSSAPSSTQNKSHSSREYNKQLASLNCSLRDWVTKHVNDNPLCDLSPIFSDYKKHLASIEQKHGGSSDSGSESDASSRQSESFSLPTLSSSKLQQGAGTALFTFSSDQKESTTSEKRAGSAASAAPATNVTFNFGKKVDSSVLGALSTTNTAAASAFSFASQGTSSLFGSQGKPPATSTFSFGLSAPQTTSGNGNTPKEEKGNEEETEEPPKPVVNEVKEDDAFYSKKCKLFYKKENEFKEKGVGTLHLKQVAQQKTQLLVRADTNLGNILLNILVQSSMPCTRMGKNNVMVVCVPNPPVDEKSPTTPVPMLIRVKTEQDADELHKIITEKKSA